MTLVNEIGWFAATLKKPVTYKSRIFTTIQETMVKKSIYGYMIGKGRNDIKFLSVYLLLLLLVIA
jgi:hypothetical protein